MTQYQKPLDLFDLGDGEPWERIKRKERQGRIREGLPNGPEGWGREQHVA